ncbi:MAG: zeta toxin family protein [Alphaproteobacteria bacterium]|nr:zeta toxin family protein [Alphaproteobacteria bacterium]
MQKAFKTNSKPFVFDRIAGVEIKASTTEEDIYQTIRDFHHSDEAGALAERLGIDLTKDMTEGVVNDTKTYVQKAFEGKKPVPANQTPQNFTLQGAPGTGKTEAGQKIYQALPEAQKQHMVYNASDEYGVIESIGLWKELMQRSEACDFAFRLDARDLVRQATAVGYDLVKNRTFRDRYSAFNDTTVSSPFAVRAMEQAAQLGYRNSGAAFHAPWGEAMKRCLARARALDIETEGFGKRAPVMQNFPGYIQAIIKTGGDLSYYFTPSYQAAFLRHSAFQIEDSILVARNDPELNRVIGALGHDLDMARTKNDQALRRAVQTYGAVLDDIREAPLGKRLDMERFIAPGRGEP